MVKEKTKKVHFIRIQERTLQKYTAVLRHGKEVCGKISIAEDILLDWLSSMPTAKITAILKEGMAKR